MRPLLLLAAAGAALSLAACSGGDGEDAGGPTASTSSSPATSTQPETTTDPPTTQPEPARPLRLERVAAGLESPLYLTAAPGEPGRLYVVLQGGHIVVLEASRVRPRPFLDIADEVVAGGEQGLLSVAFHPEYERNRRLYVNYTNVDGDTRVVEYQANGKRTAVDESSARVLLAVDQPYSNHNGGQLQFGPDGKLWVGMGDGGSGGDPEDRAQDLSERLGKLLTIDVDRPEPRIEIAAYGLRNPWRFSFDRETDDLWIGDVGQGDFEEIDYLPRSRIGRLANFGWDAREGNAVYEEKEPNQAGTLVDPIAVYSHNRGCSVTGGYVYRGPEVGDATGRYFYGDYCSGLVWSLSLEGRRSSIRREPFEVPVLSSFGEDAAGRLYLVSLEGRIFRLAG